MVSIEGAESAEKDPVGETPAMAGLLGECSTSARRGRRGGIERDDMECLLIESVRDGRARRRRRARGE